jgi:glutamine amidotransferase
VSTLTNYGIPFVSSIWKENLFGTQFHPEKSQQKGLKILENFARSI